MKPFSKLKFLLPVLQVKSFHGSKSELHKKVQSEKATCHPHTLLQATRFPPLEATSYQFPVYLKGKKLNV